MEKNIVDTLRAEPLENSPVGEKQSSAENASSLLSCRSPSFWTSHSGQTGLGNARIIFLIRRRSKSSLQDENQHGVLECDRDLPWV